MSIFKAFKIDFSAMYKTKPKNQNTAMNILDYNIKTYVDNVLDLHRQRLQFPNMGYDFSFHAKTHYLIVTGHDLIFFLMAKHGLYSHKNGEVEVPTNFDYSKAIEELFAQSFVHSRKSIPLQRTGIATYMFYAPKKRVDRWFKQNKNRFFVKK
jgi:hypothetical protein